MATLHGKGAVVYLAPGTGAAVKISEAAEYSIDVSTEFAPDPALGDTWKTKLKGLMDAKGSVTGNFDNAQKTIWDAATSATHSAFYLYPSAAATTLYYYGNVWPNMNMGGGVSGKINSGFSFEVNGELAINAP